MERIMTKISLAVVSATLAIAMAVPVQAGINDPEVIIYRFPGVLDNGGGSNAGVATSFHCTNFSGATEIIRFATRNGSGSLVSNQAFNIEHLRTTTASTHKRLLRTLAEADRCPDGHSARWSRPGRDQATCQ
jgi:hypothetical protein